MQSERFSVDFCISCRHSLNEGVKVTLISRYLSSQDRIACRLSHSIPASSFSVQLVKSLFAFGYNGGENAFSKWHIWRRQLYTDTHLKKGFINSCNIRAMLQKSMLTKWSKKCTSHSQKKLPHRDYIPKLVTLASSDFYCRSFVFVRLQVHVDLLQHLFQIIIPSKYTLTESYSLHVPLSNV